MDNDAWYAPILNALGEVLTFLHDFVEPLFGAHAWGWAIILLTLVVRILLLPLAIKQTRSMRAMQRLQPQIKELQKKYKVDRDLMKKDPEQYKAKRQKLNEEMMALYQKEGANPAASCLPLLAQAPIFIALFWTLRTMSELDGAPFYFFTSVGGGGLEQLVNGAGWPGWLLIVLMSGSLFLSQKQMMSRNPMQAEGPMAQQQKIMLYAMPIFLAVVSFNFPMGILLYWVTTNVWQVAQQWIVLRDAHREKAVDQDDAAGTSKAATSGKPSGGKGGGAKTADSAGSPKDGGSAKGGGSKAGGGKAGGGKGGAKDASKAADASATGDSSDATGPQDNGHRADDQPTKKRKDHLPRRGGGSRS